MEYFKGYDKSDPEHEEWVTSIYDKIKNAAQ
jgi:hypothetical protein